MIKDYFEIVFDNGTIKGDLRYNKGTKMPLLFFLHGFKSFRNWGFIPFFCDKLAENGYNVINFDHSHNGIIDEDKLIFDPEIFANQKVSSHYRDYINMNNYVRLFRKINDVNLDEIWDGRIYNIGHSMGGALSYVASSEVKIDKIVSLAAVSRLDRNTERQKKIWKENGFTEIKIRGSEQILHLNYSYSEDKDKYFTNEIMPNCIKNYEGEYLVIHPKNDIVAKLDEAKEIFESGIYKDKKELFVIEGTGHTFSIGHPFTGENKYIRAAIEKTIEFLSKNE